MSLTKIRSLISLILDIISCNLPKSIPYTSSLVCRGMQSGILRNDLIAYLHRDKPPRSDQELAKILLKSLSLPIHVCTVRTSLMCTRIENVLTSSSQAGLRVYWQSSSSIILLVPALKISAQIKRDFHSWNRAYGLSVIYFPFSSPLLPTLSGSFFPRDKCQIPIRNRSAIHDVTKAAFST